MPFNYHLLSIVGLLAALSMASVSATTQIESREIGIQCKNLPLIGKGCIQINATGCGSMLGPVKFAITMLESISIDLGSLTPKAQRSIGMLELMDHLRRRQAALVQEGKPEFPVTECFESRDTPVTFCYDVTSFSQSSLRNGASGNAVTISLAIRATALSTTYTFNFGTFTIEGCDMLSCGLEPNLCSSQGTCTSFGCGCNAGFWGPQCAFQQIANDQSQGCIQTSGSDQICPTVSVDAPCENIIIGLNSNEGAEKITVPFAAGLDTTLKLKCVSNFLSSGCESCTVVDDLQMGTSVVGAHTLSGCVGVVISCPDSDPMSHMFQCKREFIPVLPPSCVSWVPTANHHHHGGMPMSQMSPTTQPLPPSEDEQSGGVPTAEGGSKTKWMVIFVFLAMLAVGAGVLYWYARSRGGIRSLFSNKTEIHYVRQADFDISELDGIDLDEDTPASSGATKSRSQQDHPDTVDVELQ